MTTAGTPSPQPNRSGRVIEAKAATYYRVTRYLMVGLFVGFGVWFAYDGYIGYPNENDERALLMTQRDAAQRANDNDKVAELDEEIKSHKFHTDADLVIQRLLAVVLPIAGLGILGWALYNSRGAYRLADGVLSVPGHARVPLERIREIDRGLWDRKGIAHVTYDLLDGRGAQSFKIDDFVYDRDATDEIFDQIEAYLKA